MRAGRRAGLPKALKELRRCRGEDMERTEFIARPQPGLPACTSLCTQVLLRLRIQVLVARQTTPSVAVAEHQGRLKAWHQRQLRLTHGCSLRTFRRVRLTYQFPSGSSFSAIRFGQSSWRRAFEI